MERIVLGLGSNKKFRGFSSVELLGQACDMLSEFVMDMEMSSVYRTSAMYFTEQDDFYNMVVSGKFEGNPDTLLDRIHSVENTLGRNRALEFRNGPRSMDIDIELFGVQTVRTENLVIPHERLCERSFVLVPLLEILKKNTDVNKVDIEFYTEKLSLLKGQFIEKFCTLN